MPILFTKIPNRRHDLLHQNAGVSPFHKCNSKKSVVIAVDRGSVFAERHIATDRQRSCHKIWISAMSDGQCSQFITECCDTMHSPQRLTKYGFCKQWQQMAVVRRGQFRIRKTCILFAVANMLFPLIFFKQCGRSAAVKRPWSGIRNWKYTIWAILLIETEYGLNEISIAIKNFHRSVIAGTTVHHNVRLNCCSIKCNGSTRCYFIDQLLCDPVIFSPFQGHWTAANWLVWLVTALFHPITQNLIYGNWLKTLVRRSFCLIEFLYKSAEHRDGCNEAARY